MPDPYVAVMPVRDGALLVSSSIRYIMLGDINTSRTALLTAVYVGMVQNILSKATKYAVFDPTKEMAYIPLDQESKVSGIDLRRIVGVVDFELVLWRCLRAIEHRRTPAASWQGGK